MIIPRDMGARLAVRPEAEGVRISGPGIEIELTLAVARSLAYRLLAVAEEEERTE